MADLGTILVNADSTNGPREWASQSYLNIDEGISAADGAAIGDNANPSGGDFLTTSFLLEFPTDLQDVDTLSFNIRYRVTGAQTNDRDLLIRIVDDTSAGYTLAGATVTGNYQSIETAISNTTFANSGSTAFTYVRTDTTTRPNAWQTARLEIRLNITRNKGGDTNGIEVDTVELTGTYTPTVDADVLLAQTGSFTLTGKNADLDAGREVQAQIKR